MVYNKLQCIILRYCESVNVFTVFVKNLLILRGHILMYELVVGVYTSSFLCDFPQEELIVVENRITNQCFIVCKMHLLNVYIQLINAK